MEQERLVCDSGSSEFHLEVPNLWLVELEQCMDLLMQTAEWYYLQNAVYFFELSGSME